MTDGVNLNSAGVCLLAKNIITHIAGPSEGTYQSTPLHDITLQRTRFGEILFSDALKKPATAAWDIAIEFRVSNQYWDLFKGDVGEYSADMKRFATTLHLYSAKI